MQEITVHEARTRAEQALGERDFEQALAGYTAVLASDPDHLDARLRVADCLLALGRVQDAAVVYTTLARHAANLGYPLRAVVAIKILVTLDPALSSLMGALADLYCEASARIGVGVRPVPRSEASVLSEHARGFLQARGNPLFAAALQAGRDLTRCIQGYPQVLPPIPLLSELNRADFVALLETLTLLRRPAGSRILAQGEVGRCFYIASRGDLAVRRSLDDQTSVELATLHEGAVFGEMALVSASARGAHVDAIREVDLLELDVGALSRLSSGAITFARALDRFTRERMVMNLIATAPLFRPLDRAQRIDLVRRFVAHDVAAGTDVIREGERVPGLYVVLSGSVDVWKRDNQEKVLLATLKTGDVFGEMSLLGNTPATATVSAVQRSTLLFLAREYVERLVESIPELRTYLEDLGEERALDTKMWLDDAAIYDGL